LYLVYLALRDLLYALYVIATYGSLVDQKLHRVVFTLVALPSEVESHLYAPDLMVVMTYKFLNIAINTIVSHEVLVLLRTSPQNGEPIGGSNLCRLAFLVSRVLLGSEYRTHGHAAFDSSRSIAWSGVEKASASSGEL
jgi:hypothetical protein